MQNLPVPQSTVVLLQNFIVMKKSFTLIIAVFCALQMSAQITIERSEYLFEYGTARTWIRADNEAEVVLPAEGEDMLWDFTNLTFNPDNLYSNNINFAYDGELFPNATGVISNNIESDLFPGVPRQVDFYSLYNDETYRTIGRVSYQTLFPIGSLTGTATDSLIYLETVNMYSDNPGGVVNFPITFGEVVQDGTARLSVDILLTATPFGLDHTPGEIVGLNTGTTTVSGWGKIRVNEPGSGLPVDIPVLMTAENRTTVDSFYLGGAPAPQSLLDAFGQTQGSSESFTNYTFYAEGFPHAIMDIRTGSDDDYTLLAGAVIGYVSSLYIPQEDLLNITTAPNPTNGAFNLTFDKTDSKDRIFEMIDMQGRTVHRQVFSGGEGVQRFDVNVVNYVAGAHPYIIRDETGKIVGSGKVMLK